MLMWRVHHRIVGILPRTVATLAKTSDLRGAVPNFMLIIRMDYDMPVNYRNNILY